MTQASVSLADGSVTAVGATLPADRPTSWVPPGLSGQLAASCYVITAGGHALIVDTGLGVHWDTVRDGLDGILAAASTRALIMTRREPDAIGNLPAIIARYGLDAVYCGGVISPVDFFERVDRASAAMGLRAIAHTDVTWVPPGTRVSVGPIELAVLPTTLRVLPKNHLYDPRSRTLFSSDTWVLVPQSSPGPVEVVRTKHNRFTVRSIESDLRRRFEWLVGIDTSPMQGEIASLLCGNQIDRICPSYGCVIEGAALAAWVLRNTISALKELSERPRVNRLSSSKLDEINQALSVGPRSY